MLCSKCKTERTPADFYDEKRSWCKDCHRSYARARTRSYYAANREACILRMREWAKANAERKRAYNREYYHRVWKHKMKARRLENEGK